ncbi:MAG: mercury transporter MerT [Henriciella sp.]|jgi:mercuric ion transport protein|nr:mercury transporter MerT [Henriciella sp.]|tara:strand:- start:2614 stop:2988 length:375 start_codon:yes stop_codon:yes gene_type:complete
MADTRNSTAKEQRSGWLVGGGIIGALLASSCCIVPLVLISLGISGAWIGQLTAVEPYKPLFLLVAIGCLAAGFRDVYFRKTRACDDGSVCARPHTSVTKQVALWSGTLLVLAALTIDLWAPFFY